MSDHDSEAQEYRATVKAELERQLRHYKKLADGKPESHEYAQLADFYSNELLRFDREGDAVTVSQDVWTCPTFHNDPRTLLRERRFAGSLAAAQDVCMCLNDCGAVKVRVTLSVPDRRLQTLSPSEVQKEFGIE